MRNAKDSALNRYAVKNGRNRDGNESARKGLGCTNRSCRLDWLPGGMTWGELKIARQAPLLDAEGDLDADEFGPWWTLLDDPDFIVENGVFCYAPPQPEYSGVFTASGYRLGDLSDIDRHHATGAQIYEYDCDGYRGWVDADDHYIA